MDLQLTCVDLTMVFMDEARATLRGANALAEASMATRTTTRNFIILTWEDYNCLSIPSWLRRLQRLIRIRIQINRNFSGCVVSWTKSLVSKFKLRAYVRSFFNFCRIISDLPGFGVSFRAFRIMSQKTVYSIQNKHYPDKFTTASLSLTGPISCVGGVW